MTIQDQGQPRQPAFAPASTGGEYTVKPLSPPEINLNAMSHEGSFLYPRGDWRTADEYIAYWESVQVSDRVLSNLDYLYTEERHKAIGDGLDTWAYNRTFDIEFNRWKAAKGRTPDEIDQANAAARAHEKERLEASWPVTRIHPLGIRKIALAGQMYRLMEALPADQRPQVAAYEVQVGPNLRTVRELWDRYHLAHLVDSAFVDQDVAVNRNLWEMRQHMGAFTTNV